MLFRVLIANCPEPRDLKLSFRARGSGSGISNLDGRGDPAALRPSQHPPPPPHKKQLGV